jgi:hypothetical protein
MADGFAPIAVDTRSDCAKESGAKAIKDALMMNLEDKGEDAADMNAPNKLDGNFLTADIMQT